MGFPRTGLATATHLTAATLLIFLSAVPASHATATSPLFDFQSTPLTNNFRQSFSQVGNATVNVDVPYGLDEAQKYDVYLPDTRNNAPIIVMIHGGAWSTGDKEDAGVAQAKAGYWVAKGYVFVSINYRLLPKKDPLVQAADVALAIANVQKNAAGWGADKSKVILMGTGAGGHLAALLSANPSLASDQGASIWSGAVILETSALNIPAIMAASHAPVYDTAFGSNIEFWEDSSPTDLLSSSGVPMLVVCSTESPDNTCTKASAFAQSARSAGVTISVLPQSMKPADVNSQLGVAGAYTSTVDHFIESIL